MGCEDLTLERETSGIANGQGLVLGGHLGDDSRHDGALTVGYCPVQWA